MIGKKEELLKKKEDAKTAIASIGTINIITLVSIAMMGVGLFAKPNKVSFITGAVGFALSSLLLLAVTVFCIIITVQAVSELKEVNRSLKNIDYPEQGLSKSTGV